MELMHESKCRNKVSSGTSWIAEFGESIFVLGDSGWRFLINIISIRKISQEIRQFNSIMALNPQLYDNGMPVAFVNEIFVLIREAVEFEITNINGAPGGTFKGKGRIFLSNVRIVFVAEKPTPIFTAFDMPLLYVHGEKFSQPVFHCNNISGLVEPVVPEDQNRAMYPTHKFKILFKNGGCGTLVPLFFNLLKVVRQRNQQSETSPLLDPLLAAQTPVEEMMNCAYVDPSDPTKIYLQQPASLLYRRATYHH